MNTSLKALPKNTVEITVEISPDELLPHLEAAAKKISATHHVPGFRPGKVPYAVLKKSVGDDVIYHEAFEPLVKATYPDIVKGQKLTTIGAPKIEIIKIAPGNPLVYKATVALEPEVTLGDYKGLRVHRQKTIVTDAEIDKLLNELCERRAKETLVRRAARMGDKAEVDFTGYLDKVPIEGGSSTTHPMVLGSNQFVPGFEEKLVGMEAGQKKEFTIRFPANYFRKALANRDVEFTVTLHAVYERELPAVDNGFAKSMGSYKTPHDLRSHLKKNIEAEKKQKEKDRFELAMLEKILEISKVGEIADSMVDEEVEKMMGELEQHVADQGMKMTEYLKSLEKSEEDMKKAFRPQAERRMKMALVNRKIAEIEKIEASDDEVRKEIEDTKKIYSGNARIESELSSPEYFRYLKNMLSNRRVIAFLDEMIGVDVA